MPVENWLANMLIDEVSLVIEGENDHALVDIVKAKGGGHDDTNPMMVKFAKMGAIIKEAHARRRSASALNEISAGFGALRDKLDAILADDGLTPVQKAKIIGADFDEFRVKLDDLAPDAVISKAVTEALVAITKGENPDDILEEITMDATQLRDALSTAEATIEKANAKIATLEGEIVVLKKAKAVDPNDDAAVFEGMTPVAIEKFKKLRDDQTATNAMIAKMADDAGTAELVTLCKAKLVPQPDLVGAALYRISKGKAKDASTTTVDGKETVVPGDVEIVKQALFAKAAAGKANLKVVGVDIAKGREDGEGEAGNPLDTLTARATEIAKAKSISKDAAMTEAMDEMPEVYAAYTLQKKRAAAGV